MVIVCYCIFVYAYNNALKCVRYYTLIRKIFPPLALQRKHPSSICHESDIGDLKEDALYHLMSKRCKTGYQSCIPRPCCSKRPLYGEQKSHDTIDKEIFCLAWPRGFVVANRRSSSAVQTSPSKASIFSITLILSVSFMNSQDFSKIVSCVLYDNTSIILKHSAVSLGLKLPTALQGLGMTQQIRAHKCMMDGANDFPFKEPHCLASMRLGSANCALSMHSAFSES